MSLLLLVGLLLLNFGISWFNCYTCGSIWVESKKVGGFMRLLVWCGVIQSVVGFSSVFLLAFTYVAYALHYLPKEGIQYVMSLWYVLVIVPAIGSGLIITIHSWREAWRTRSMTDMGIAAWNTFAQAHNVYTAFDGVPSAFSSLGNLFRSDSDSDDSLAALVFLIVVLALGSSIVLTYMLIKKYSHQSIPLATVNA